MDLLIKGMEMPKDGNETIVRIQPDGTILDQYGHHLAITAVPVPTPHGRLIDADESIEVQMFDEMYEEWTLKTMSVADYLAFAADVPQTIIEAEEE